MGTRSDIIVERTDGTWKRIYCHWDGYPDHNGRLLHEHYSSQELADAVVAPGDMSSLDEKCDKPEGHSYETKVKGYSVYYGRDRGETDTDGKVGKTLKAVWPKNSGTEFTYVWSTLHPKNEPQWFVGDPDKTPDSLVPLADVLAGAAPIPDSNVKAFGGNFVIGKRKPGKKVSASA